MKLILLAATAALALPALAQAQMGQTAPTTAPADPSAQSGTAPAQMGQTAPTTAPTDPSAQPGATPTPATPPAPTSDGQQAATPAGGYQPSGPAMQGTMTPGVQPTYQPAPSPDQAYPAPAAKASYPVCKKGQYDGCIEPGGKGTHKRARHKA